MTDSKIIEQIRQLLRIASDRGASINERELAQRRAERLMVRHRIETLPEGDARARDEDVTSIKVEINGSSSSMVRVRGPFRGGRTMRYARDLMIDRDGEAGGQRDGYASGIGWMGERLDGPRVGIAAS